MRPLALLFLFFALASAEDRWSRFQGGPFELYTDAGARRARETLTVFEQYRFILGRTLGIDDLKTDQPIRILLFKSSREAAAQGARTPVLQGRDAYDVLLAAGAPIPPVVFRECTRWFLNGGTARMPEPIEHGLADLFSTIEVSTVHITLGKPVPPPERTRDWARVHLLAASSEYYGKLRILLFNLQKGVDEDAAYQNAIGKSRAEFEKQADEYLAAGNFPSIAISGRPILAEREFIEKILDRDAVQLALADLLILPQSQTTYEALVRAKQNLPQALEGLGLLALRQNKTDEARRFFEESVAAGSPSGRPYLEYARLESDNAKAVAALQQAVKLNPGSAESWFLLSRRESDSAGRVEHLKQATALAPREAAYWQALAEAYTGRHEYGDAAKAWTAAEQAAATPEQRTKMQLARLAIEQQRLDYEALERRRILDEQEREIRKLKDEAIVELRAAEAKANAGAGPKPQKVVPWWEGPKPAGRVEGILKRVDCAGGRARFVIEDNDHKLRTLLVRDPSAVAITGSGDLAFSCGAQKPRHVVVEYFPNKGRTAGLLGEVATISFQ